MGISPKPRISHYWSSDSLLGVTDVRECMFSLGKALQELPWSNSASLYRL